MRYIAHICVTLIQCAVISLVIAVAFGGLRYIGYLLSWIEKPTWLNVIGMAILLWVIMVIKGLVSVCMFIYRCHKDPVFKRAAIQTGISWKDYKRLRGK
jgi:hypothetical protein